MASKLLYLVMNWKKFNKFSLLEHVRGVIRALKTSIMALLTIDTHSGTYS